METIANDRLNLWREEGQRIIQKNFQVFRSLLEQARDFVRCGNYDAAAVYAKMAAVCANFNHCGLFASPELEQVLIEIGRKALPKDCYSNKGKATPPTPKNVLHIATSVVGFGGHGRMLRRWIQQDTERYHSLVITEEPRAVIPKLLSEAVTKSGGKIYVLNETIGSLISWAKQLREIAAAADTIVLHIYNYDVIPIIAFADRENLPTIIFLNHTDHNFWLGGSICDVLANLRESGMRLSQKRRGIEPERNALLPTLVEPIQRVLSRQEAKQQLGLSENGVLLLSIARATKYQTIDGISYADAHVPLLQKYQQAVLIVIGSGERDDWLDAIERTQGRIISLPERLDTAVFYQAADIYVDSYPFISNTSLLEAGSYGVPLVTRYPYSSDICEILGADMPGLTGNLIRVRDLKEYTVVLSRLVEDEDLRLNLGEATKNKILQTHVGEYWLSSLDKIYHLAATVSRHTPPSAAIDRMLLEEPDVFIPHVYGCDFDFDQLIRSHLTIMPIRQRLHHWLKLYKNHGFRHTSSPLGQLAPFKFLIPEWLLWQIKRSLR
ncbi:glycosyl transferase family 1 [Scytonema hofmannii PCC 7110]|uniref:Glycosyl transferase family 1 n=1 Tax=Scytonema hofmannii PCC 7110 TaxID=128403 RepID=A0A139WZ67_9CYAN|nr:glycosyltransferase [Scytonema hofmannii]KYC37749.1 glycosyl transferase family 1 [Scytonema hofmannii PCC 7110]